MCRKFCAACKFQLWNRAYVHLTFLTCRRIPAWKRLIDCPPDLNDRISLITEIFSDRDEVEAVRRLRGEDAQSFVDIVDEVYPTLLAWRNRPTDLNFS